MTRITPNFTLGFTDLKNIFNDISTGYTPTNAPDESFRDFSKLENLDTPTPLESSEAEPIFVYSVTTSSTESQDSILTDPHRPLQYCKPEPCTEQGYGTAFSTTDGFMLTTEQLPVTSCYPDTHQYAEQKQYTQASSQHLHITDSTAFSTTCPVYATQPALYLEPNSVCTFQSCIQPTPIYTTSATTNILPVCNNTTLNNNKHITELQPYLVQHTSYRGSPPLCSSQSISPTPANNRNPSDLSIYSNTMNTPVSNATQFESCKMTPIKPEDTTGTKPVRAPKILVKAFSCEFPNCIKRFARIDELKRHQRTHSDVKQFVCDICQKGFTRSDHLMTHRRTHTGERPYPCWHCDRRFARSDERNRHAKVHSREKTGRARKPRGSKAKAAATNFIPSSEVPTVWLNNLSLMA